MGDFDWPAVGEAYLQVLKYIGIALLVFIGWYFGYEQGKDAGREAAEESTPR